MVQIRKGAQFDEVKYLQGKLAQERDQAVQEKLRERIKAAEARAKANK